MERDINLDEITDGKRYTGNDLVKADCGGCQGCSACCHGMGNSIVLDPLDMHHLVQATNQTFEALMAKYIELSIADGIILPNIKMDNELEQCSFLDSEGRCTVHASRPGICRMFPLGRVYEENSFYYVLQVHECKKEERTKIKVRKWLDIPDLKRYEQFVADWHYFLKDVQGKLKAMTDEALVKKINMFILSQFFIAPYETDVDFYEQFEERLQKAKSIFI